MRPPSSAAAHSGTLHWSTLVRSATARIDWSFGRNRRITLRSTRLDSTRLEPMLWRFDAPRRINAMQRGIRCRYGQRRVSSSRSSATVRTGCGMHTACNMHTCITRHTACNMHTCIMPASLVGATRELDAVRVSLDSNTAARCTRSLRRRSAAAVICAVLSAERSPLSGCGATESGVKPSRKLCSRPMADHWVRSDPDAPIE